VELEVEAVVQALNVASVLFVGSSEGGAYMLHHPLHHLESPPMVPEVPLQNLIGLSLGVVR